jgi:hypothetical protein
VSYDTYGSERSWSPVEDVTVKRGECSVSREACTPATRSDKGSIASMQRKRGATLTRTVSNKVTVHVANVKVGCGDNRLCKD